MSRLSNPRQNIQHLAVAFARVSLPRDGTYVVEPHLSRDEPVELADFLMVATKQREEARLGSSCALRPAKR